jgi:hypothetical protein
MHLVHRVLAAAAGLHNAAGNTRFPCGVLLRRRKAFAGADAGRDAAGDAALSAVDPQLDYAAWGFDAADHRPSRPRTGLALRRLPLSGLRMRGTVRLMIQARRATACRRPRKIVALWKWLDSDALPSDPADILKL